MLTEWTHQSTDSYVVTGLYYESTKRFKIQTTNPHYALGINLWRGHVWLVRDGKRRCVKSVYN